MKLKKRSSVSQSFACESANLSKRLDISDELDLRTSNVCCCMDLELEVDRRARYADAELGMLLTGERLSLLRGFGAGDVGI
jgi:hypothetical protein